jgi:opacity protein-like surface antigen
MKRLLKAASRDFLPSWVLALSLFLGFGAAEPHDFQATLSTGLSLPADPPEFPELWKTGWSVGGGLGIRLAPQWELAFTAHYQRFPTDEAAQIEDLFLVGPGAPGGVAVRSIDGRAVRTLTFLSECRFHFATESVRASPFLAFGIGYLAVSTSDAMVVPAREDLGPIAVQGDTDNALAVNVGGGLEFALSRSTALVLDSLYTIGFTDGVSTQYLPIRLGISFH